MRAIEEGGTTYMYTHTYAHIPNKIITKLFIVTCMGKSKGPPMLYIWCTYSMLNMAYI